MSPRPTYCPFAVRWLSGFGCVGALFAGALAVAFNVGLLALLAIAVLGAIVGLMVGVGLAKVVVVLADSLGWDDRPETSHIGRLVRRMDQVIDEVGL